MSERKTAENLKGLIYEILTEWEINLCQIRDRGSNIKKACEDLFGPERHMCCFAHIVNTIATNAIGFYKKSPKHSPPEVDAFLPDDENSDQESEILDDNQNELNLLIKVIRKVKRIVTFFRKSEIAATELKNFQKTEWNKKDIECLKLVQEVRTRWNSLYLMIERYLHLNEFVGRVLLKLCRQKSSKQKPPADLTTDEINSLTEIKDLLHPLYLITLELSSEKHVTISKCIPLVKMLRTANILFNIFSPEFRLYAHYHNNLFTYFQSVSRFQCTDPISFNLKSYLISFLEFFVTYFI